MKVKKLLIIISPFVILGCATLWIYYDLRTYAETPAEVGALDKIVVNVNTGQSLKSTANILHQKEIIKDALRFVLIARIKGYDKRMKAGEYLLSAAMPPEKILDIMVKGAVQLHKLTVPEGYNIYQIGELVTKANFGKKGDFVQAAKDTLLAKKIGLEIETFEGYLFPDTYFFPKEITVEKIIMAMVQRFRTVFTSDWEVRAKSLGLTVHQIVTLASIIEKETGASFERPIISSVFHNRLKKKMRLESDPTVIYGIENFDGNLTRKHLKTRTPYNTYKIKGLPAGPIANPGRASLEAALYPANTSYIYFVSKKDNTHHFSTDLKQHNKAVRKYQLRRKK